MPDPEAAGNQWDESAVETLLAASFKATEDQSSVTLDSCE